MRDVMKRTVWGIVLIAIGIGYLGQVMGFWEFTLFFSGWWTMLIILPALYNMFDRGISFLSMFLLLVGFYCLAQANDWISFSLTIPVLFAAGCICSGLKILFPRRIKWYDYGHKD